MSMEIVITYETTKPGNYETLGGFHMGPDEIETHVEVYTLPVVACARMDVLTKAGITPCLTVTRSPIVEVN